MKRLEGKTSLIAGLRRERGLTTKPGNADGADQHLRKYSKFPDFSYSANNGFREDDGLEEDLWPTIIVGRYAPPILGPAGHILEAAVPPASVLDCICPAFCVAPVRNAGA
ncbi:hypothetical protein [Leisingera sp. ANG-M7]|uniref:hypothetical protein n=1 Tax=Leisingera sp. ANG-M7 TaxID=1577902 RepID=UPI00187C39F1